MCPGKRFRRYDRRSRSQLPRPPLCGVLQRTSAEYHSRFGNRLYRKFRGVYKFPVEKRAGATYADHQSSGYDVEYCSWSNVPDEDFALADDYDWTIGQFVWTGFDYLGEPSPYDTDAWPSHSSVFGIIDLASLPKDRYYLYRSIWNKTANTLHVLPGAGVLCPSYQVNLSNT